MAALLLLALLAVATGCQESRAPAVESKPVPADTSQVPAARPEPLQGVHVRHDTTMIDSPIERSPR